MTFLELVGAVTLFAAGVALVLGAVRFLFGPEPGDDP